MVTTFPNIDDLREHLLNKASPEGISAIEAMVDRLRIQGLAPPEPDEQSGKVAAGRRA